MYNAIIDDEHLNPMGIYKERLSQSALVAEMRLVTEREARDAYGLADRPRHGVPPRERRRDRADRGRRSWTSSACTWPPCASPTGSGATRSGSSTSRASRTWRRPRTWPRACSTTPTGRRSATSRPATRAVRRRAAPALQRGRRGLGRGRPRDEPGLDGARPGSGDDAPRRPLGRPVRRRLRVGVRDLRCGAAGPPRRRLCRGRQRAPAAGLLRAGWRHDQGREPAGRDRLEPRVPHGRRLHADLGRGTVVELPRPRRSDAGRRPRRSGRSCTRSSTASAATR